ncbi:MAG: RluA family pseudouridine synthase [Eubacteriales bacterium]|nr:RluA family pseudouridine synthase [Eubacteriales bacterium]
MRQWIHKVTEEENGKKAEQILRAAGFSRKEISRLKFIRGGIQADGEQIRSTDILRAGQELALELGDRASGVPDAAEGMPPLEVCYEDEDILIVNKPSGLSCHPGRGHYHDNLGSQAAAYCKERGENISVRLIGRLDKDTSGLVLFAKNQAAAARLWRQREEGICRKTYQALVHGRIEGPQGCINLPMEKVPGEKNRMRVCLQEMTESDKINAANKTKPDDKARPDNTEKEGMKAVTCYHVAKEYTYKDSCFSLLECTLQTGRTHQIRVHMAAIGHPVVGDRIYGKSDGAGRLWLHACRLCLLQPFSQNEIVVSSFIQKTR